MATFQPTAGQRWSRGSPRTLAAVRRQVGMWAGGMLPAGWPGTTSALMALISQKARQVGTAVASVCLHIKHVMGWVGLGSCTPGQAPD